MGSLTEARLIPVSYTHLDVYKRQGMCVTIVTLPVILIISGQIPVISLFLNVIVIPLMSLIMISGIFTGIAGMLSLRCV